MTLERWVDYSKWQGPVGPDKLARMKADGVAGIWPGAWHGIDANPYVQNNLRDGRELGLGTGTYIVLNANPGGWTVRQGRAAVGDEWAPLRFVALDIEIRGVTEQIVRDAAAEVRRLGQRPCIYTGNWFWNWWALELGHFPNVGELPVIIAVYNGVPDLNIQSRPGYGPIVGHQYTSSTGAYGTTVDFNVIDKGWLEEEDDMTTAELAAVLRRIKVKKDKPLGAPLTADEAALYDNMVSLFANIALDYTDGILSRPSGRKGQMDAWSKMVRHPHPASDDRGLSEAQVRAIAQEEDAKLKVTK